MAMILSGKPVAAALDEKLREKIAWLKSKSVTPALAIVRVGERPDDMAYERSAAKRCEAIGIIVRRFGLPADAPSNDLPEVISSISGDEAIHGCLLFRPFPKHMDENAARGALLPAKDIDGITDGSLAGVFAGIDAGFAPCTPEACMEILAFYGIDPSGKRAVVVGRSLVAGKPAAMMLIQRNATVTVCHTKTADMPAICREADILVVAAGRAAMIGKEHVRPGQVVIDVGINVDGEGKIRGDVNFGEAEPVVGAITPVPGGVGAVTTSVLAKHVVESASRACGERP